MTITVVSLPSAGADKSKTFQPGEPVTVGQWELLDLRFRCGELPSSPFDITADALLKRPGGDTLKIPLFYNGDMEFILRIAPPEQGRWHFNLATAIIGLDGLSGIIEVGASSPDTHGAIVIPPGSQQSFSYSDGTPYFPIAFECDWLFALDAHDRGGIPKTRTLIDHIADNGFNQVVMNVYAYDVAWPKDPKLPEEFDYSRPAYSPFAGTNETPDFSRLNLPFFQHLDRVIAELKRRDVVAHLMIYVWNKKVNWPDAGSTGDNRYFDHVIKRYQAYPNIIWDISKEALGYGHNDVGYITDRIKRLRSLDAFGRLVTVHDYGYCNRFPDQVDFISTQTWSTDLYSTMTKIRSKHPGKPVLNIEHGGYETGPYHVFTGDYLSAEVCLERSWQCVFAGVYPTYYWQDTSWSVVVHDPSQLPLHQQPKFGYYRNLAEFVRTHRLGELQPSSRKFSSSGHCLTDGKQRFLYFVPKENNAIHLKVPLGIGQPIRSAWYDPFTGQLSETVEAKFQLHHTLYPPDNNHFNILMVEKASADGTLAGERSPQISR